MKSILIRNYTQFSWPLKITGYIIGIFFCLLIPPFTPIILWAIYQAELNRRKDVVMTKLNNWAIYNIDEARSLGIEPNFRKALGANGITGLYLDITSYNADPSIEDYCRKGGRLPVGASENLSKEEIQILIKKLKRLEKGDFIGCLGAIVLVILFFVLLGLIAQDTSFKMEDIYFFL